MEKAKLTMQEVGRRGGVANAARHDTAHFRALGKKGGAAVKQRYGREHYQALGRRGAAAKWKKADDAAA